MLSKHVQPTRRPWRAAAVALLALVLACASCATSKLGVRTQIDGTRGPITASPYAPEPEEACVEIGSEVCRYWDDPSRSITSQCVESLQVQAANAGANYVEVDIPKSTDLHYDTDLPTAVFHRCKNLIAGE